MGCKLCRARTLSPQELWSKRSFPILVRHFEVLKLSNDQLLQLAGEINFEFGSDPSITLDPVEEFKFYLALRSRNQLYELKEKLFGDSPEGWALYSKTIQTFLYKKNIQAVLPLSIFQRSKL
jgi:hypothetical protein